MNTTDRILYVVQADRGGLAQVGYDAEWDCLPASDLGADHERERLWVLAYPTSCRWAEVLRDVTGRRNASPVVWTPNDADPCPSPSERVARLEQVLGEPALLARDDGFPDRLAALQAVGNSIYPDAAEAVFRAIEHLETLTDSTTMTPDTPQTLPERLRDNAPRAWPLDLATLLREAAERIEALTKSLRWSLTEFEAVLGPDDEHVKPRWWEVPRHRCEFFSNPEKGACDFHGAWVDATDLLRPVEARPASDPSSDTSKAPEGLHGAGKGIQTDSGDTQP